MDKVAILQGGMQSGKASMSLIINLSDESIGIIDLSVKQFNMIAAIVKGVCQRWGEEYE